MTAVNETVLLDIADGIATVTLNRPQAMNALNLDMVEGLYAAFSRCEEDAGVRCVVLKGAGGVFMGGGDVKMFAALLNEPDRSLRAFFERMIHQVHESVLVLRRMPKPVIASVRGPAAGFGLSLVLASDLALASDDALFTLAYCHLGTSPDGGSTFHLPRAVGTKKAMELALLGDRFGAAEAERLGLVNRMVPAAELEAETAKLARRLASGPTLAYARTKALLNESFERPLEKQLQAETESFARSASGRDFAEGVAAFIGKRPPQFRGE